MPFDIDPSADDAALEQDKIQAKLESSRKFIVAALRGAPTVPHVDIGFNSQGPYLTAEAKLLGQEVYKAEVKGSRCRPPNPRFVGSSGRGHMGWMVQG